MSFFRATHIPRRDELPAERIDNATEPTGLREEGLPSILDADAVDQFHKSIDRGVLHTLEALEARPHSHAEKFAGDRSGDERPDNTTLTVASP
jgi:hypothetical protein